MRASALVVVALGACRGDAAQSDVADAVTCDPGYVSVSAEARCAVCGSGRVHCWGDTTPPHVVAGIDDAVEVAGNGDVTCARTRRGTVSCWGKLAELGLHGDAAEIALPARASHIAVGGWHACALLDSHEVACWGHNTRSQLGTLDVGANPSGAVPARAIPDLRANAISAKGSVTCVVETDGHASCFGYNGTGALGVGDRASHAGPVRPHGIDDAVDVATDGSRACARRHDGDIWCWGDSSAWDDRDEAPAPLAPRKMQAHCAAGAIAVVTQNAGSDSPPTGVVVAAPPLRAISTSASGGCSLDESGNLRCWGSSAHGWPQLAGARPETCTEP